MKKLILIIYVMALVSVNAQKAPFNRGVNLTEWFQTYSATSIQFNKFSKKDFENIKSLGCDVIRLPIRMHSMTLGAPDYKVDPLLFNFLDNVIGWAEETGLHLILDNHTFAVQATTTPEIIDTLIPVWRQFAERYKDSYANIYYEMLNEPHGIDDSTWNRIQGETIEAIREIDTKHYIIVGPAGWNSYKNLNLMPEYSDDKLIYTFHFYDPFIFTHQGAPWSNPSLENLSGVPFQYNPTDMPECPPEFIGTWIESTINNYNVTGTVSALSTTLNIVRNFKLERNVPIFCGEFGVLKFYSPADDRTFWYQAVKNILEANEFSWTSWDYQGGFGLFENNTNELFDYDLNIPLVEALGFNAPPQYEYTKTPDSTALSLYDDYFAQGISILNNMDVNFYDANNYHSGKYSIHITGGAQYSSLTLNFVQEKDLSYIKAEDYVFECYVKGTTPEATLDIRFLDTKTDDPDDHPWRMGFTLTSDMVPWDGNWHKLTVPLSSFVEKGSWDNDQWYNPENKFDWKSVSLIQIVAEQSAINGQNFWFDDMKIYDPTAVSTEEEKITPDEFTLKQNYPNPFNPETTIEFTLPQKEWVTLKVYNISGELVTTLLNKTMQEGIHKINFKAGNIPSGIYFYTLKTQNTELTQKMVLLK